jgi:hypothetical protein
LALLLAKGFICFAGEESTVNVAERYGLLHAAKVLALNPPR